MSFLSKLFKKVESPHLNITKKDLNRLRNGEKIYSNCTKTNKTYVIQLSSENYNKEKIGKEDLVITKPNMQKTKAQEMKELAEASQPPIEEEKIKEVYNLIEKEAKKGNFSLQIDFNFFKLKKNTEQELRNRLEKDGFYICPTISIYGHSICWSE